ncbi:plasma membrane ascorbate-dependent reductase CYBRD1-like [Lethenteron reissneri]|uniref:plasma membrane ascorbate-dependent reductase CYBRD1-like n=1 Tax=Lethenteron reissneri TaxID=7753 RepID=UPI002AB60CD8|nr:plasma membrane ascorbate-dependent reductase CYBRD1-like [Lethenteron reissneri]
MRDGVVLRAALGTSAVLGLLAAALVAAWQWGWRGGVAWDGGARHFNWHPLLMILGPVVLNGLAMVLYRIPWTLGSSKMLLKCVHAGLQTFSFLLVVLALVAVFDFHNVKNIPNMYSLHSWVGLTAVLLFSMQWALGLAIFLFPGSPASLRAFSKPIHAYLGLFIFIAFLAAALTGITEKLIFSLKPGNNTKAYSELPAEGMFVNTLGMLLLAFGGCVVYIVVRPEWQRPPELAASELAGDVTVWPGGDNSSEQGTSKRLPFRIEEEGSQRCTL